MEVYSRKPIKAGELLYYTPLLHYFTTLIHRETPHGDVLEEAYPGGGTVAGAAGPHPEALTCVPGRSRPLGASVPVLCMWGHLYLSCVCVHVCMCVRMYVHTHGDLCFGTCGLDIVEKTRDNFFYAAARLGRLGFRV
jgi:hypothetical protein